MITIMISFYDAGLIFLPRNSFNPLVYQLDLNIFAFWLSDMFRESSACVLCVQTFSLEQHRAEIPLLTGCLQVPFQFCK